VRYLNLLLICVPLAIVGGFLRWSPLFLFWIAALGVIPLARWMGRATEELAAYVGPRVGGLLNATLGNAAELIIAIFAIREGLLELVKASITGSILGNLLLVMEQACSWEDCATITSTLIAVTPVSMRL
jgi:Ca2+:H+ antiporter